MGAVGAEVSVRIESANGVGIDVGVCVNIQIHIRVNVPIGP